jgi:hypothetical protein
MGKASGLARNRRFEDGPLDETLGILAVEREGGGKGEASPLATLASFGAHPTLLYTENFLLTGEFPAFARRIVEEETEGAFLFLNGAGGDQAPVVPGGEKGFAAVRVFGAALADRVLSQREGLGAVETPSLGVAHERVILPAVNTKPLAGPVLRVLTDRLVSLFAEEDALVQAMRIGEARLVAFPCDLGAGVGIELRERFPGDPLLLASYTNEYVGYVVDARSWERGGYEAMMSFHGPGLAEKFVAAAAAALRRLESP